MAKIVVTINHNWHAIAALAGSNREQLSHDPNNDELEVPDVTQPALDAAFADYTANQVARDTAFLQSEIDTETDKVRDDFDDQRILKAFAELLVDELNVLRQLHGLPARTFAQLRTAIRSKIT